MLRAQHPGGFSSIGQLIVREGRSVADGISRPFFTVQIHQREQQPGIDPATKKQSYRHIANKLTLDRGLIQSKELFCGFGGRLCRTKRLGLEVVPAAYFAGAIFDRQLGAGRELVHSFEYGVRRRRKSIPQEKIQSSRCRFPRGPAWPRG